ncbi:hypothetical protein RHMOL_Rhmol11G0114200 [Rhododendron molle]|uniref:Uncharacterized protein n=1 Tax=Rhododendron molle TaxID=49168 RepID=A0ACC0LS18_RHOML|nr:hypothetical protein RHMOL_Rhmol11G0114200 [Rhododendron molle]
MVCNEDQLYEQKNEGDGRWDYSEDGRVENKEDLNALEIEELETQNVELRVKLEEFEAQNTELSVKMEDVEAKNESLRGRTKAMKEDIELANLKVKWFTALVVILVGLGIVYFGGKGWLKKKLLSLP